MKVRVLGILLSPLLKKLGYRTNRADLGLPESSYYYGRSGLVDLVEIHLGFLSRSGWLESRNCNRSFYNGEFQPWLTFAATHFLSSIDMAGMSVVEFGGGASTVWFSKRASNVKTFEFDAPWAAVLSEHLQASSNVEIIQPESGLGILRAFKSEPNAGLSSILAMDIDSDYFVCSTKEPLSQASLILVDGGPRNLAMYLASKYAAPSALIVVDNSDIHELREGVQYLLQAGFTEIPFRGLGPLNPYESTTSVFVKSIAFTQLG
jgi:hypothetical protein